MPEDSKGILSGNQIDPNTNNWVAITVNNGTRNATIWLQQEINIRALFTRQKTNGFGGLWAERILTLNFNSVVAPQ
jgi:hypothetical protein